MVFSSVTFLFFFLPLFFALYYVVPSIAGRNIIALAASFVFYAWGEMGFLPGLVAAVLLNAYAARLIDSLEGTPRAAALTVTVGVNLALLGAFKYGDFLVTNINAALPASFRLPAPHLPLPLGISFFTFHCLSYVIDVYRRRFPANRRLAEIALYIMLFPQLIAGPIVRYSTIARQLRQRRVRLWRVSAGARILVIGLAQKVLIADQVARLAEAVFDHGQAPNMAEAWLGTLAYTIQIYFDFNGYSNIAIGLALAMGFAFPRNFRLPYTARSITGFWRRWHMSLSAWFRDYLYIPLGGNRKGMGRTYINLLTVFLLCGLWHGAAWTFVLWGLWHGGFLIIERAGLEKKLRGQPAIVGWTYTTLVVMFGWVLFRAHDVSSAARIGASMLGFGRTGPMAFETHRVLTPGVIVPLLAGCALALAPAFWPRLKAPLLARLPRHLPPIGAAADACLTFGLLLLSVLSIAAGTYSPFLYFRF